VLVRIACHDLEAQLAARDAEHGAAEAFYRKLVNGARPEDIDIAQADLKLAEARLAEAQLRLTRSLTLFDRNAVSQATRDTDERDVRVATAQVDAARLRLRLLKAGTREEEVAEAKARMIAAQHAIDATQAEWRSVRSRVRSTALCCASKYPRASSSACSIRSRSSRSRRSASTVFGPRWTSTTCRASGRVRPSRSWSTHRPRAAFADTCRASPRRWAAGRY